MMRISKTAAVLGGIAVAAALVGYAAAAAAQSAPSGPSTPKNWNYEIKDGKRVPKGDRVTAADGSWREEVRQGKCITIKEKSPAGEYKETRRCD
jgi:Spy/CpxP family protein refolding chaperone